LVVFFLLHSPAFGKEVIHVVGSEFSPDRLEINTCEEIEFINVDRVDHQFQYFVNGAKRTLYLLGQGVAGSPAPDTRIIELDSGTYEFRCIPHPWMHKLTIHVEVDDEKCRAERNSPPR